MVIITGRDGWSFHVRTVGSQYTPEVRKFKDWVGPGPLQERQGILRGLGDTVELKGLTGGKDGFPESMSMS